MRSQLGDRFHIWLLEIGLGIGRGRGSFEGGNESGCTGTTNKETGFFHQMNERNKLFNEQNRNDASERSQLPSYEIVAYPQLDALFASLQHRAFRGEL